MLLTTKYFDTLTNKSCRYTYDLDMDRDDQTWMDRDDKTWMDSNEQT